MYVYLYVDIAYIYVIFSEDKYIYVYEHIKKESERKPAIYCLGSGDRERGWSGVVETVNDY